MDNQSNKCSMCGSQFNSQQELEAHVKQAHSNQSNQDQQEHEISCSKCGMKAKSPQDLEAHEQQHSMSS